MVIDKIENAELYAHLSPLIKKAFRYIRETDFNALEPGKYVIEHDNLFSILMEYDTKDIKDCQLEAHRKYIDVQYMISGSELVGVTPYVSQAVTKAYSDEDDYALFAGDPSLIRFEAGQFAIFFPGDLHMPGLKITESAKVKKAVLKVRYTEPAMAL